MHIKRHAPSAFFQQNHLQNIGKNVSGRQGKMASAINADGLPAGMQVQAVAEWMAKVLGKAFPTIALTVSALSTSNPAKPIIRITYTGQVQRKNTVCPISETVTLEGPWMHHEPSGTWITKRDARAMTLLQRGGVPVCVQEDGLHIAVGEKDDSELIHTSLGLECIALEPQPQKLFNWEKQRDRRHHFLE